MIFKYLCPVLGMGMILGACLLSHESEFQDLRIVSWNVQNLFDDEVTGEEYDEYNPEKSEWNREKMLSKMENLKAVIYGLGEDLPDIILLQEVENRNVLALFNRDYLGGGYDYLDAWKSSDSAICCGMLSKIKPLKVHLHFPGKFGKRPLRSVAEIHFDVAGERLILFNNHWKSRSGGSAATEKGRLMSSAVLAARVRELRGQGQRNLIAAGDFNGSVEDFHPGKGQSAQLPVEVLQTASWQEGLYVSSQKEDTDLSLEQTVLYSPWNTITVPGTYFFKNKWMKLDHFFLDKGFWDKKGFELEAVSCGNVPEASDDKGHPAAWKSWQGKGASDHFPLILDLTFVQEDEE